MNSKDATITTVTAQCPHCGEHTYFDGLDGAPAGCVNCGAGSCGRIFGRFSYAGPRHCGKPTAPDEQICPDCMAELDIESQREHEREHAAGRL